jgi:uncharacterized membrane protein YdbT with pleckstrin-like domain
MSLNIPDLVEFLRSTTIFNGVDDTGLAEIAGLFKEFDALTGEYLCQKGDLTEGFFLIYDGEAELINERRTAEAENMLLNTGDFAGEEALFYLPRRTSHVVITRPSTILFLSNRQIPKLLEQFPMIRENISVLSDSRILCQKLAFSWLGENEYIHVISRKHPALLLGAISLPIFFFISVMLLSVLLSTLWSPSSIAGIVIIAIGFVISAIWLGWNIFNWSNDYYILTNQRMVWIEKVAGVYDSRQEAPLSSLMSVGVSKTRLGNLIGYADVTVRTFVGPISFKNVAYAPQIAGMIEAYWQRSKVSELADDEEEMRKALKRKLSGEDAIPLEDIATQPMRSGASQQPREAREATFWEWLFADFLKLRFETGGVVTYRKHWLVLLKHTILPLILLISGIVFGSAILANAFKLTNKTPLLILTLIYLVVVFGWLMYNFIDWRNDIYQLSDDQVIDVERKPLGKENRRAAPLESILSIEYERKGILAMLFNFGTVYITVGNTKLSFDFVYHPSDVQQDIFARMGSHQEEKRKIAVAQERERVSGWFKVYHEETKERQNGTETDPGVNDLTRKVTPPD